MDTKSEEYKKFLAEKIKLGDQAVQQGRTYSSEQVYENAIRAALKAAEGMKRSA
ncbi:hypothetical protein [Testudinibacter sp. TR-2022]|uniref:hypothetical protein n=1 Tax=Testudinibacter sp. TR-2022 TaxID=2585029 RepID=UPI00159BA16E|nr:hypothetical protein [Testudinibacter sp. TR-2022]